MEHPILLLPLYFLGLYITSFAFGYSNLNWRDEKLFFTLFFWLFGLAFIFVNLGQNYHQNRP